MLARACAGWNGRYEKAKGAEKDAKLKDSKQGFKPGCDLLSPYPIGIITHSLFFSKMIHERNLGFTAAPETPFAPALLEELNKLREEKLAADKTRKAAEARTLEVFFFVVGL